MKKIILLVAIITNTIPVEWSSPSQIFHVLKTKASQHKKIIYALAGIIALSKIARECRKKIHQKSFSSYKYALLDYKLSSDKNWNDYLYAGYLHNIENQDSQIAEYLTKDIFSKNLSKEEQFKKILERVDLYKKLPKKFIESTILKKHWDKNQEKRQEFTINQLNAEYLIHRFNLDEKLRDQFAIKDNKIIEDVTTQLNIPLNSDFLSFITSLEKQKILIEKYFYLQTYMRAFWPHQNKTFQTKCFQILDFQKFLQSPRNDNTEKNYQWGKSYTSRQEIQKLLHDNTITIQEFSNKVDDLDYSFFNDVEYDSNNLANNLSIKYPKNRILLIDETDLSENEKQNFESFKALSQLIKEQFLKFIEPLKKINTCIKSNEIEDYISKIKETKTTLISFNQPIDMLDYFNILRDYINKIEKICFDNLLNIKAFDFDRDIFNTIIDDFSDSKLDQRLLNDDLHNKIERSIEDYSNIVQKFYAFSENFCSLYNQIYKDQKYNLLYALSIGYDIKQYLATSNPEQKNANILKQYYQNLKNKESTEYKTLPSEKNSTLEDYFAEKQVIYHQSEEELSHNKEIFQCKIPMLIQHSKNFRNDVTTTFDVKMIENFNSHRDTFLKILQNDLKYEHHQTLYDYSNFVICAMIHMNINKLTDNMYSSVKKALNDKILYDNDPLTIDSLKEIINNSCEKDKKADDPV